jgi:hypothetical protein
MSNTQNRYFDGTELHNLSLQSDNADQDGSIEVEGSVYTGNILSYNIGTGIIIEKSIFQNGVISINSTQSIINSSANLIVNGNSIFYGNSFFPNTTSSFLLNTSSSLNILGGINVYKNFNVGGTLTLFNTTSNSLISLGTVSIQNTIDALSLTSGGSFVVSGGASIQKTLFADIINVNTLNSNVTYTTYGNILNSNLINNTVLNTIITNATINSVLVQNESIVNSSISNLYVINENITYSTISNLYSNVLNSNIFSGSLGDISVLTVGNLHVTNSIEYNEIISNLSSANIVGNFCTISSLQLTIGTFGTLFGNDLIISNLSASNLYNSNLTSLNAITTNLTSLNTIITNLTSLNTITTNLTSSSIFTTNITSSSIFTTNLTSLNTITTNVTSLNTITTNLTSLNAITTNFINNFSTIGSLQLNTGFFGSTFTQNSTIENLLLTGSGASLNSTFGTLILLNGGISINNTVDCNSITSGGALTVAGGVSIGKNLIVNSTISSNTLTTTNASITNANITNTNVTNASITNANVTNASISNANVTNTSIANANITNASTSNFYGINSIVTNISNSSLITNYINTNIINGTSSTFQLVSSSNLININSSISSIQLTNGTFGALFGSYLEVYNSTIHSLLSNSSTISNLYINGTQPSINSSYGALSVLGGISVNSTENSLSCIYGGGITNRGGMSIAKDLYVCGNTFLHGTLDLGGGIITNVTSPNNLLDVVNKYYVDNRFTQFTIGNVSGNFTQGQVIVASTLGNITGYPTFTFDGTLLSINSTVDSINASSPGVLNVLGGANFQSVYILKGLDLSNNKITNVTAPSNLLDVANKYYVDNRLSQFTIGNVSGNFTQGQVIVASTLGSITGYPTFTFDGTLLSINSTVDSINASSPGVLNVLGGANFSQSVYMLKGLDLSNNKITNVTGPSNLLDVANKWYVDNHSINGNFTQGQVIIGASTGSLNGYSNFTFNGTLLSINSTINSLNASSPGVLNVLGGANFHQSVYMLKGLDVCNNKITNLSDPIHALDAVNKEYVDFYLGISTGDIKENVFVLNNNQNTSADISGFYFNNTLVSSFEALVYLQIPELNIYDQWEINGILKGNNWVINIKFIWDYPSNVNFTITSQGQMQYTNNNSTGTATIRFKANTTSQGIYTNITTSNINPITQVLNGGTGTNFFTQGTLLIGNDNNSIFTDINLLYTSGSLVTSKITGLSLPINGTDAVNKNYVDNHSASSINSTEDSTSASSGGAFTDFGGAGISKKLYVGTFLYVNNVNLTPNLGDIFYEKTFNANNNINIPSDITGFYFNNALVTYFTAIVSVLITTNTSTITSGNEIKGIQLSNLWQINSTSIGENTGIKFSITNLGQVQYISKNIINWTSTVIKFRALTTTF